MSRYTLGKLFFDANSDRQMRLVQRFHQDPETVMEEYGLSESEKQAMRDKNIRAVYEAGVHPVLVRMGGLALLGLRDVNLYREALLGAVQVDD